MIKTDFDAEDVLGWLYPAFQGRSVAVLSPLFDALTKLLEEDIAKQPGHYNLSRLEDQTDFAKPVSVEFTRIDLSYPTPAYGHLFSCYMRAQITIGAPDEAVSHELISRIFEFMRLVPLSKLLEIARARLARKNLSRVIPEVMRFYFYN